MFSRRTSFLGFFELHDQRSYKQVLIKMMFQHNVEHRKHSDILDLIRKYLILSLIFAKIKYKKFSDLSTARNIHM